MDVLWGLLNSARLNTFLAASVSTASAVSSDYPQEIETTSVRGEGV